MHAAGGRRWQHLVLWRQLWLAGGLFALGALVAGMLAEWSFSRERSAAVFVILLVGVSLLVLDGELKLRRHYRDTDRYASRFVQLYRAGGERNLSMEEENELWGIVSRRLGYCSQLRTLGFVHGMKPAEDTFLESAYSYLTGSRPEIATLRLPELEMASRKAS